MSNQDYISPWFDIKRNLSVYSCLLDILNEIINFFGESAGRLGEGGRRRIFAYFPQFFVDYCADLNGFRGFLVDPFPHVLNRFGTGFSGKMAAWRPRGPAVGSITYRVFLNYLSTLISLLIEGQAIISGKSYLHTCSIGERTC